MTGVAAVALTFVATAGEAMPLRGATAVGTLIAQPLETVQFIDDYDDEYYAPAPTYRPSYRVYREPPVQEYHAPRRAYRAPVQEYYAPRPVYRAPNQLFYDKEAAKDYVKSYRRAQKEIFKEQVRGWNRAHGY
jgi:hypothetical protein